MPLYQRITAAAGYVASAVSSVLLSSTVAGDVLPRLQMLGDGTVLMADPAVAVSGVSGTSTLTFTTAAHSVAVNDPVVVAGVAGMAGVNGSWTVASVPSATTFTVTGAAASGTYTSGGQVQRTWGGQGVTNEGFWNLIQNSSTKALLSLRGRRASTGNLLSVVDYTNAPIFVVPVAGGPAVFGDNFRVFNGGNVFDPTIKLRLDGTVQMAKGDPAGGSGVLAIGQVTTTPTGKPDGTHTLDGSITQAGAILWSDSVGRIFAKRVNGVTDSLTGFRPAGSVNVSAVGDWLTPGCSIQSTYPLVVGDISKMFLVPIDVTDPSAVYNSVGSLATVAGAGATYQQFRFGIYQDDGSGTRPNLALQVADFGVGSNGYTSLQATTPVVTLTSTYSFPNAGRFWLAVAYESSGTVTTYPTLTTAQTALLASGNSDLSATGRGWYVTGVPGALPTSGALVSTLVVPYVGFRRSA